MKKFTIVHLYPEEMNIYGDRGNVIALAKRLMWRGLEVQVDRVGIGDKYDFRKADILFGGGGQDKGQAVIAEDLQARAKKLKEAAEQGVAMLVICGTYQLFGKRFITSTGKVIPGIGLFAAETKASGQRMIGNIVIDSDFGELVGFENHSGQTTLAHNQRPLGDVIKGYGNNSKSSFEGAVYKNVFGSYLHGPLLPKNPRLADELIRRALRRNLKPSRLKTLDDNLEEAAAAIAKSRPQ